MRFHIAPLTGLALGGLCAINCWLLTVVLRSAVVETQRPPAIPASRSQLLENATSLLFIKPAGEYGEILTHPVFYKTRAPYVPPPPPPPAPQIPVTPPVPVDPGIALGGVIIRGDLKKAYLFSKGGAAGTWVSEGEMFMGWIVRSIDSTSTKLQQSNGTIDLQLYPRR
jgi:hypothetical protein